MTPLKNETLAAENQSVSAERLKNKKNMFNKSLDDLSHKGNKDRIDYQLTKISQSTEMVQRKFVSKIDRNSGMKIKNERSPLIRHDKLEEGLMSGGQSDLEND